MPDYQHKPGDVANGHRLTKQPDGSLAWLPIGPDHRYEMGDVANGHRLTQQEDGTKAWLPVNAVQDAPTEAFPAAGQDAPTEVFAASPSDTPTMAYAPTQNTGPQQFGPTASAPGQPFTYPPTQAGSGAAKPKRKRTGLIVGGVVAAFLILIITIGAINGGKNTPPEAANDTTSEEADVATEPEPEPEPETVAIPTGLVGMTATEAETALTAAGLETVYDGEPDAKVLSVDPSTGEVEVGSTVTLTVEQPPVLTIGQQNAVSQGESYLAYSGFSRSGLIDQLEYEGYSVEDATFAVDYIAPDWNAEAAEKAKSYIEYSSFSRQGLLDQLLYEGFSQAEAEFGVTSVGY